jgi:ELWxxDGT repeat protein
MPLTKKAISQLSFQLSFTALYSNYQILIIMCNLYKTKGVLFVSLFILLGLSSYAQPVLVTDFNPGEGDGLDQFSPKAYPLGDLYIMTVIDSAAGEELGAFENGELRLLKDINAGSGDANLRDFVYFNDLLYFVATDESGQTSIWSTDGTETGTVSAISVSGTPRHLIVSQAGDLFFTMGGKLYRTPDGNEITELADEVEFEVHSGNGAENYTTYQDGIAFFRKPSSSVLQLLAYTDTIVQLGSDMATDFTSEPLGLNEIEGGLVFSNFRSFSPNPEINGTSAYRAANDVISKYPQVETCSRYIELSEDRIIGYVNAEGFYTLSISPFSVTPLLTDVNPSPLSTDPIPNARAAGKVIFHSDESATSFFGEHISITDGTTSGTSLLVPTEVPFISNMISYGDYVFFAAGTQNGFEPQIFGVNAAAESIDYTYFSFEEGLSRSVQPLFFQDGKLYFIGHLDSEIGRELYFVETGIADPPLSASIIEVASNLCAEDSDAAIEVVTAGGLPPYTYEWSEAGLEGANPQGLVSGAYSVTVSDQSIADPIELSIEIGPEPIVVNLESITPEVDNQQDGAITISAEGGTPPFEFAWDTTPSQNGTTLSNLSAGNYTVSITDANGCQTVQTYTVELVLALNEPKTEWLSGVYPNPVNDILNMDVKPGIAQPETLSLYDATGKIIRELQFTPQLDVRQLPSGNYWLAVTGKRGVQVLPFVKR